MRGCLSFLVFVVAILLIGGWFLLPTLAGAGVSGALGLAGFSGTNTSVTVTADPPLELVTLHADSIHITSTDASFRELRMAGVDVRLVDVQLGNRTAGSVSGTLTGVRLVPANGPEVRLSSATLTGSGDQIGATLTLSLADATALATSAVKGQLGTTPAKVTLAAPDRVSVTVSGVTVGGRISVDGAGGLVFRPSDSSGLFSKPMDLIRPGAGVPIHFETATVTPSGVRLGATLDPAMFGG